MRFGISATSSILPKNLRTRLRPVKVCAIVLSRFVAPCATDCPERVRRRGTDMLLVELREQPVFHHRSGHLERLARPITATPVEICRLPIVASPGATKRPPELPECLLT